MKEQIKKKREWIDDYEWSKGFKGLWVIIVLISYWIWFCVTILFKLSWSLIKVIGKIMDDYSKKQDKKFKKEDKKFSKTNNGGY